MKIWVGSKLIEVSDDDIKQISVLEEDLERGCEYIRANIHTNDNMVPYITELKQDEIDKYEHIVKKLNFKYFEKLAEKHFLDE